MQDDRQMDLALWRYGIISPLLHRDANDVQLFEMLAVISQNSYIHPHDGRYVTLSAEAIRKWLYRFNHGGLESLCDKERSDKGKKRCAGGYRRGNDRTQASSSSLDIGTDTSGVGRPQIVGRKPVRAAPHCIDSPEITI